MKDHGVNLHLKMLGGGRHRQCLEADAQVELFNIKASVLDYQISIRSG